MRRIARKPKRADMVSISDIARLLTGTDRGTSVSDAVSGLRPATVRQDFGDVGGEPESQAVNLTRRKLEVFSAALNRFHWPDSLLGNARMVAPSSAADEIVSASVASTPQTYSRFFSRGLRGDDPTALDAGTYKFQATQGGKSESYSVKVEKGWTNNDVLTAVSDALNKGELKIQAETVRQTAANQKIAGLAATGTALAVAVNPTYDSSDLAIGDTSGHLIGSLKLDKVKAGIGPASLARYDVRQTQDSVTGNSVSRSQDPDAATSLSVGDYSIDYAVGSRTGTISFSVRSGDTWGDVLNRLSGAIGQHGDDLKAELVTRTRLTDTQVPGRTTYMQGRALSVTAVDPKLGERLSLKDGSASSGVLNTLGLNATATPGRDGGLSVNGESLTRTPGVFDLDSGRVSLETQDSFSGDLPLKVVEAVEGLRTGLTDIVTAYNDVRRTMTANSLSFKSGLAESLRAPYAANRDAAAGFGLTEMGRSGLLLVMDEPFFAAVGSSPTQVKDTLTGSTGILTGWKTRTGELLSGGLQSFQGNTQDRSNPLTALTSQTFESDLEKRQRVFHLADSDKASGFEIKLERAPRFFDLKG